MVTMGSPAGWTANGKWHSQPPVGRAELGSAGGDVAETGPLTSCTETVPWGSTRGYEEDWGLHEAKDRITGADDKKEDQQGGRVR